jgi:60 kDa SS-A/Ro ribonucleoprotein
MASNALKNLTSAEKGLKTNTPQTVRTPGRTDEVKNNAGGFVFTVSDKSRLERFLILGTDGGTYYVGEQKLTKDNAEFLRKMIRANERLVVETIVEVSSAGRAYRNSPALFALALVMTEGTDKAAARAAVQKVARTSTHLFEFAQYVDDLGGWGRAKRKAVAEWYESKDSDDLAYQAVKYRQRNGWTHRDLMRLSHPEGVDQRVGNFILGKSDQGEVASGYKPVAVLDGFGQVQAAATAKEVIGTLEVYKNLPWETIPTQFLKDVDVWKTLFYNGQIKGQALVRNIVRLARIGAFKDMKFAGDYAKALTDVEMIRKTRLHPINFLNALVVYEEGQVDRRNDSDYGYGYSYGYRNKDWEVEGVIRDALNTGFHLAFKTIEPAGKRTMLALDVSGSMGGMANGLDLTCAQVGAAMAMTIARSEPYYKVMGFATQFRDLGVSPGDDLAATLRKTSNLSFGGTDCALPMQYAEKNGIAVDTFVVITDNETWAGGTKPFQALKNYRKATGIDARLAVFGVAASPFTIADPSDRGMMDFVGFDSNAPRVLADFSAGRL